MPIVIHFFSEGMAGMALQSCKDKKATSASDDLVNLLFFEY